jgi:DHA1 family bicyclomycin/chloramphenicol resistance-like MFS transporter
MGMGGVASALVSVFHNGTAMPMVAVMVFCILGGLISLLLGTAVLKAYPHEDAEDDAQVIGDIGA